jgi:transcriptional regulator with XRE-family HTH domain
MSTTPKMTTTHRAVLGAVLQKLKKEGELDLKQSDLAAAAGVGASTWSRVEKGDNPLTTEQLRKVAERLGTRPSTILALAEESAKELEAKGIAVLDEFPGSSTESKDKEGNENEGVNAAKAAAMASLTIAVPLVGPVLGGIVAGLSAYSLWKDKSK